MEILVLAAILGLIPGIIAERKGYSGFLWWLFGALMFILALPISLLLPTKPEALRKNKAAEGRIPCPSCAEYIMPEARICPFCQQTVPH